MSILGYVVRLVEGDAAMSSHRGRDVTARQLMHWNQVSMEKNDEG